MASQTAIAMRQQEATDRITQAASQMSKAVEVEVDLTPTHRDKDIRYAMQLEALADLLEATVKGLARQRTTIARLEADNSRLLAAGEDTNKQATRQPPAKRKS